MKRIKFTLYASLIIAVFFLSSCGWHLRGSAPLADELSILHLQLADPHSDMSRTIKRAFTALGATLKTSLHQKDGAPLSLITSKISQQRRTVSTSSRGKDAEYALISSIVYKIKNTDGAIISGPTMLSVEKIYLFDSDNVVGSYNEEQLLRHEMQRDLVQQLLRRYRAIKIANIAPHEH